VKLTDLQFASLTISLSTLGQTNVRDNDPESLRTLEYLLEQALANVRRAVLAQTAQHTSADDHGKPWLNEM
jgi:hypothetical protein